MQYKVINVVRNFLKEYFPTVDVYDGPLYHLYIKGFSLLFKQEIDKINADASESLQEKLDIRNYATMARDDLKRIGRMYFLEPSDGAYASAILTVELTRPAKCNITEGSEFGTTDGLRFYASRTISFSAAQVGDSQIGDVYRITVPVTAAEVGSEYEVEAGAINTVVSSLNLPIKRVYNAAAATGGANYETNTEFYLRLVRSINTRELLITDASIKTTIEAAFPVIREVNVAGKGHTRMQRDRVYDSFSPDGMVPYEKSSFYGKRLGVRAYNSNLAYAGRLDAASLSGVTISDVLDAVSEVTQEDYYDIASFDSQFMQVRAGLEFSDDFDPATTSELVADAAAYYDDNWIFTDSGYEFGKKRYGDSIRIAGGYLCLGAEEDVMFASIEV
jgi:hypothetical protein